MRDSLVRGTVVLVDDHPVVLKGLKQILTSAGFRVLGEATTGGEGVVLAAQTKPHAVIVDLRLPDRFAPEILRELRRRRVEARTVVLTGFDDEHLLRACLDEGASAILLKDVDELDVPRVLERVLAGDRVLSPRLSMRLASSAGAGAAARQGLTAREHEVLRLLARGLTSADIAAELYLSVNTVRGYAQSLLAKLGAHSRIEAVAAARRLGLI